MDLLHKCIGGTAVSAVGVEVVVDLERVDSVFRLEYVHGEEIAVDCLEHRERDVAEPLGVPVPLDPRAGGDAQHAVALIGGPAPVRVDDPDGPSDGDTPAACRPDHLLDQQILLTSLGPLERLAEGVADLDPATAVAVERLEERFSLPLALTVARPVL